jgi:aminoglycoside phosphotransferase (APT) family kinase protein
MNPNASHSVPATRPVAPRHAFDVRRLTDHLRHRLPGFDSTPQVVQFTRGHSNPTYLLSAGRHRYVLRRQPPGTLLPTAHAVDREFRVMQALADSGVPVPRVHLLCEDPTVIGTMFYVCEFVAGRIFIDPTLPALQPDERAAFYSELARVMAAMHEMAPASVGLSDFGKPGHFLARQVARWTRQYRAVQTESIDAVEQLMSWLPQHVPPGEETRIVHGDYRIENVIFHPEEPRILAVIDWELSTLGHPLVDLANHCLPWHLPAKWGGLADVGLAALNLPAEADHVQACLHRQGHKGSGALPDEWHYCVVFNLFRLVAILQGIASRRVQGNATGDRSALAQERVRPLAEQAWAMARRMHR